ncbi:NRDE family protein [Ectobacillus ponti]|uniref:NRDE family protein n=1 Tax=Ectobacillus ponti TaxID=2961894 RepID=A0AA41X8M8_9BACI|nr:NRDE family protein [Ectobacillus ponti]MCP8968400.1 NRDE family protein [Ectobacillus ponti]
MCLIHVAYQVHTRYSLIVAANRDELRDRPTAPAHFWADMPHILAGRDLERMGTWMGVTAEGRFAALTNYRNPKEETAGKRTRGELVSGFLQSAEAPEVYMRRVQEEGQAYPGFNLLVSDGGKLLYYSNVQNEVQVLQPGIYGLSNAFLNDPWPKVQRGMDGMKRCLRGAEEGLTACLLEMLQHAEPAPDELLPATGVSLEWERRLSPLFIEGADYGTRSSAVLLQNAAGIQFTERTYSGGQSEDRCFSMEISR